MNGILLLLGTNLGERKIHLNDAIQLLESNGIKIIKESFIYESEPWGNSYQPWFLNLVIEIETELDPLELLRICLETETQMGRERKEKWGERLIDIDILFYGDQIIDSPYLKVPHPRIADRRFTLVPLAEKWGALVHPIDNRSIRELLKASSDPLKVEKLI